MNNFYPIWICLPCGNRHGHKRCGVATWHENTCDICAEVTMVTEPRDFGHLKDTWMQAYAQRTAINAYINDVPANAETPTDSPNINTPQPISTAPQDETEILAWTGGTWEMAFWSIERKRWYGSHHSCTYGNELHYITHWLPMPPEPTA